jgi:hypothetical protein
MRGAQQVLEEIFMPLARRAKQVRAPDEHIAGPIGRIVGIEAGQFERPGFQRPGNVILGSIPLLIAALPTSSGLTLS